MPSPFPGMDPYLEGYLWPDVHHALSSEIRRRLAPQVRPRYAVRIEVATYHDENPESEIGIMYPDIEIWRRRSAPQALAGVSPVSSGTDIAAAERESTITQPITIPLLGYEVRIATVEVYDAIQNQLITSIEIISPYNKREPGLGKYREKQRRLREAGVHLLEIDLIRRGQRPAKTGAVVTDHDIFDAHYLTTLVRGGASSLEAWPVNVQEPLPVVAVPLRPPDHDVPLDLAAVLTTIYDEAGYDLSIDYNQNPPPPEFNAQTCEWMRQHLQETGL
ncbi:MAG: hypothetical protein ETSY1_08380 [Candidatus Entotheonella factor]|uniref:DUF4058 domain-containing protein n=1 Tax=Entotheonella factor TaxID=1429438 RepID=W4LT09_ENTF1|nr:DUF4058 family protein [Candidatus Entotheonella palauensis]ETX01189.1 MAG: hypothetical protein ETSY1_08380 [Candidatus Entotheonella factor]